MNYKYLLFYIISIIILLSCREDEDVINTPPTNSTLTVDLSGYVQKGPFINGTAITVAELDSNLVTTGKNFTTQIEDNKGSFSLKGIQLQSHFVQLQADGFYFDEVKGEKSAAQLTLFALSNVEDISSINANLLSHMERTRVIYLMQEDEKSFLDAKQQAQQEILTVFGIQKEDMQHSEILDISQEGDDNAILLAISAILQADNTVAELSELVANIITDLREDGELNSETSINKLREQAMSLNLAQIRTHLEKRYSDMGVEATIPNFEQYIDSDGDGILNKDEDDTPENFTFTLQKDVAIKSKVTSNIVTLSGLKEGGTADARVQGGQIVLNGKVVEDSVTQVKNGDQLQLQLISSDAYADTVSTKITIGTLVKNFQVVTDDYIPDAFSFTAQKDVAVDSFYTSNTITVSGIPYPTPLQIEGGIIIKNGEELESDTTSVKNDDKLAIKLLSSTEYEATSSTLVDINGVTASFNITTDDYTPDPFSFTPIKDAKRDSLYTSNTITISGLLHPTPIGVAQFDFNNYGTGKVYVNGKEYSDNNFSVKSGDEVFIMMNSYSEYEFTSTSTLTINNQKASFKITTKDNPWQQKADPPFETGLTSGFTLNDKIYALTNSGNLYVYDPNTDQWTEKAKYIGKGNRTSSGFSLNGKGYICLGKSSTSPYNVLHNELWEYDPVTDNWTQKADFPGLTRQFQTVFTSNGKAFVGLGETTTDANYPGTPSQDLWQYDPILDSWLQMSDFPGIARSGAFAMQFDEQVLVGSGWSVSIESEHNYTKIIPDLWEYNSEGDSWTQKENINFLPKAAFTSNGKGYIYCDKTEPYETASGIYQYDASEDEWNFVEASFRNYQSNSVQQYFSVLDKGYLFIPYEGFWEFTPYDE